MSGQRAAILLAVMTLWLVSPVAKARIVCHVSVQPLTFGTYLPGDFAPLDVTGTIDVSCRGEPGIFQVTLATGGSGSYLSRAMVFGTFAMLYNIYADAARTLIWGDGTGGSVVNAGSKLIAGRQDFSFPAYGRVAPQQNVSAGTYVDDVIVTVIF